MSASPANSEWLTRKQIIDGKLREAGWKIVPYQEGQPLASYQRAAVEEYPTATGPADYALIDQGLILAVVEAKKLSIGPQNVLLQAQRYAKGLIQAELGWGPFGVPFLYSTNGEVIWHHDIRHAANRSRQISGFHTPSALHERLGRHFDAEIAALNALPNDGPRLRPYQRAANAAVEQAIADRKHRMLVAMATGTGKTFTTVNQIYRLMKSGVAKRVLFLVDRRALAAQAVKAFASFDAEPGLKFNKVYEVYSERFKPGDLDEDDKKDEKFDPTELPPGYLQNPKPGHAFVYVSTIQRMTINLFGREEMLEGAEGEADDDAEREPLPIHAFDLIVADECHRGYTSSDLNIWRKTLDHFDALKIGLTATPAAHTTAYFHDIPFRYTYEEAVAQGHLVDYDVVNIKSNVRMNGLFLREGEQVGVVDPLTGAEKMDALEDQREFDSSAIEREITSPDSNRKILTEVHQYALEHQQSTGRYPKILIFAANDLAHFSHADQLVNMAREIAGQGEAFVQKITGSPTVDRPLQRIREFRNRPQPGIVVTVDMLSTGVDIPDLEFIVFLRPVKSRILFEQMLGRGTRKGEKFTDKSHFVVFDCFDGTLLAYFKNASQMELTDVTRSSRTITEIIDAIWANKDRGYNIKCLSKRLQRIAKEMHGDALAEFAAFIPDGDVAAFAAALPAALTQQFVPTMTTLRNAAFQDLLTNYKRKARQYLIAHENQDEVSSEWAVKGPDGKQYKPADYLKAFSEYVRLNPAQIDAIGILLERPQQWSPAALNQLSQKLAAAPLRFSKEHLEQAHKRHYQKDLVDIISMVKHAADAQHPLLSPAERTAQAINSITAGRTFTPDQQQWLDRIRQHLITNLSIDHDDFESMPVFTLSGGWGKAAKVFDGQLPGLLKEINSAIAA